MTEQEREAAYAALCAEAQACRVCPKLQNRIAVLSPMNGVLKPRVFFVAEAPGRQGADRTRIPMNGDASGLNFRHLLESIGLTRQDIFITNAVLCNPHTETGANRAPTAGEVRACNAYLRRTIDLLDPPIVVTLGAKALAALEQIEPHGLTLTQDAARGVEWYRRRLIPVYHPSPQVIVSRRNLAEQTEDWKAIAAVFRYSGLGCSGTANDKE